MQEQPPRPEQPGPTPTGTSTGLDPNIAALLSYVLGWITGLIFYLLEKDNSYVRFHAMQSIMFSVAVTLIVIVLQTFAGVLLFISGAFAGLLALALYVVWLASIVLWVVMMVKAAQGEKYKLPVIGDMAERYA